MVKINGKEFHDEPGSCGDCPFMNAPRSRLGQCDKNGHCLLFDEMHSRWRNIPWRCHKLFKKALTFPDGFELVLIQKG